ncbi:MAG: hypothetical protein WAV93_11430 [Bacteroidales bacterium]
MKLKVYIDVAGMENIALGKPLWNWHYSVYPADAEKDASLKCVGTFNAQLPSIDACIVPVMEALKKKEAEIQLAAYEEVREINDRRANLLALTFEGKV